MAPTTPTIKDSSDQKNKKMTSKSKSKPQHIIRSGNAGNSSKNSNPTSTAGSTLDHRSTPSLFPPGSKTPLSLLHERCQRNGWEKPLIEHRRSNQGFTATVILSKKDKKDLSIRHTVRMEPHPPLNRSSLEEAKHWAATYALFRFCNNLSLNRVLPPGPKEYWSELENEKKLAPEHRAWEFAPDPFLASLEVRKRQQAREEKITKAEKSTQDGIETDQDTNRFHKYWSKAPEVKMDQTLRDQIEQIIRKLLSQIPIADPISTSAPTADEPIKSSKPYQISSSEKENLLHKLTHMGFRAGHVSSALNQLINLRSASNSDLSSSSLQIARTFMNSFAGSSDRDALIQYLSVVVPEDDLPPRFRPEKKSAAFVTGTSKQGLGSSSNDLKISWIVESLNKKHGFPLNAVLDTVHGPSKGRKGVALEILTRRLAGWDIEVPLLEAEFVDQAIGKVSEVLISRDQKRLAEKEALESIYGHDRYQPVLAEPDTEFDILIDSDTKDDLRLRIYFHSHSLYPSQTSLLSIPIIPTFSIISPTVPSYLRLALLKGTLEQFRDQQKGWDAMVEAGEGGVIFEMVNYIEEAWSYLSRNPPDVAEVMFNFVIEKRSNIINSPETTTETTNDSSTKKNHFTPKRVTQTRTLKRIPELDNQLANRQLALRGNPDYESILAGRQSLPAWSSRAEFLEALSDPDSRVIVVAGETGSGKTTQLPQFIIEAEFEAGRGSMLNMICTQPRRVSAVGVATRVASERLEKIDENDGIVGYAIRGEKRMSQQTRLLFATSGVLIRRLATSDPNLLGISHLFVDEVHERNLEGDLLLLELRNLLSRNKKIKIILMSATANQDLFAQYFGKARKIKIPGMTYPVEDLYLEDYLNQLNYTPNLHKLGYHGSGKSNAVQNSKADQLRHQYLRMGYSENETRLLESSSKPSRSIDEQLIASIADHIIQENKSSGSIGVILIFMPGVAEIRSTCKAIENRLGSQVECLQLHSQLSSYEQKRVFDPPKPLKVKVVVATNIAETSITIPDVRYVIDSGREKQMTMDHEIGMSRLIEVNCSRAAAKQRRGRAGRTTSGVAYKLYTRACEIDAMTEDTQPEILRTPLETMFLQVKAIREDEDVGIYLQKALSPPPQLAIDRAIDTLEIVGAFENGKLTALGKHLAQIPLDLRLGKLLILGSIFGVFESTLTLAAMLSVNKPLFNSPFDQREQANLARLKFSTGNSDLLTNIKAFDEFLKIKHQSGNGAAREFCQVNFLSISTIHDIISTRFELVGQMQDLGFVPRSYQYHQQQHHHHQSTKLSQERSNPIHDYLNQNLDNINLIKSIFASGLSQLVKIQIPEKRFDVVASGTILKDVESKSVKFYDEKLGKNKCNDLIFCYPFLWNKLE